MKFLNLWQGAVFASLLALGSAQAQTAGAGNYNVSGTSASVSQTITVIVPKRFGLHLHNSNWNLDLGNPATVASSCYRAGDHSSGLGSSFTGRDTIYTNTPPLGTIPTTSTAAQKDAAILSLIRAATYSGDGTFSSSAATDPGNPYWTVGQLLWGDGRMNQTTGGYPGFYVNPTSSKLEWKGPIMCAFRTIVQKFSNNTGGFRFTASLGTTGVNSFPLPLYIADRPTLASNTTGINFTPNGVRLPLNASTATTLASSGRTTGGWLDDNILQVVLLDGTETNGVYTGTVTYNLTDVGAVAAGDSCTITDTITQVVTPGIYVDVPGIGLVCAPVRR